MQSTRPGALFLFIFGEEEEEEEEEGKDKTSECLCVFTEKEGSTRHQLRQLLANKYTLHHETNTVLQNTRAKHFPIC